MINHVRDRRLQQKVLADELARAKIPVGGPCAAFRRRGSAQRWAGSSLETSSASDRKAGGTGCVLRFWI